MDTVQALMEGLFNAALVIMIVATMFNAGLTTTTKALGSVFKNWVLVILVLFTAFILRPLVGWGLSAILGLGAASYTVMLLLASVPGAPLGVKFAMGAKADLTVAAALQVILAVIGTFTFAPTANALIGAAGLGDDFALPVADLILTVAVLQIIPFIVGMAVRHWSANTALKWRPPVAQTANITLLIVIVLALLGSFRIILDMLGDMAILAHALFVVIMFALGYFISRGDGSVRRATGSIQIGSNSGPTFAAIALAFDNDPEILGVAVALIFTQIVVGTLVSSWSGRNEAEEEA
ncbi:MAG: bile acid:sodium symporter, partial [Anaerolineaceae bacterium]